MATKYQARRYATKKMDSLQFLLGGSVGLVLSTGVAYLLDCVILNQVPATTPVTEDDNDSPEPVLVETRDALIKTRDALPAHFLIKIESFSLLSDYGIEKYETGEFVAGDYKWKLIIYPSGKEKGNYTSVYLSMSDTGSLPEDWEFNVTFTIFLYNHILDKYRSFRVNDMCFNKTNPQYGFPKFISKKALTNKTSGYLVDDNFVLGAEVLVIKRHRVVESVTLLKPTEDPKKREWKIKEISKLEEDGWISKEFTMSDVNWKIKLYPYGDSSGSKDHELAIDLVCVSANTFDAHQKVKAEFCICMKGRPGAVRSSGKLSHWFTSSNKSCGPKAFISFATLSNPKDGFLVDDCCTLQVEIYVQLVV